MFAIYGKHMAEPRWQTVVPNIAKHFSKWLYKALGLVNIEKKLENRTFFVRKGVIIF